MAIQLTPALQSKVEELVESGSFDDPEAVLEALLVLLQRREEQLRWLRDEVKLGVDQIERGEFVVYTSETMARLVSESASRSALGLPVKDAVKPRE
jgi:putative addiction module CopG family antidote